MKKKSTITSKNRIHVLLIALTISLVAILGACSSQQAEFPTGEFQTDFTLIHFLPDGKFTVYNRALDSYDVSDGDYTINGNKITFVDGSNEGCGTDAGQYTWDFDGERNQISFELIEDNCEGRKDALKVRFLMVK